MRLTFVFAAALLASCNVVPIASSTTLDEAHVSRSFASRDTRPHDVFFVVDSLPSPQIARRESEIIRSIVSDLITGDVNHDGQLEITPIDDIRFMVIPSDPDYLRLHELPEFAFHYSPDVDLAAFARSVADAVVHPFDGASDWPQPLEAARFAVTEACVPNERATVGIVFVTTQDDHSLATGGFVSSRSVDAPSNGLPTLQPMERYQPLLRRSDGRSTVLAVIGGVPDVALDTDFLPARTPQVPSSTERVASECGAIALRSPERLMALAPFRTATASYCGEIDNHLRWFLQVLSDGSAPRDCLYFDDPPQGDDAALHEIAPFGAVALDCNVPGRTPDPANHRECLIARASATQSGWYLESQRESSWECTYGTQLRFSRGFVHRGAGYRLDSVGEIAPAARPL